MKKLKKGFTLVELVIVIAVIAVLAAVLIPVFSGVVQRANYTADLETTKTVQNYLAGKTLNSMQDVNNAIKESSENRLSLQTLVQKSASHHYAWDSVSKEFVLLDNNYHVVFPEQFAENNPSFWMLISNSNQIVHKDGILLNYYMTRDLSSDVRIQNGASFDAGENTLKANLNYNLGEQAVSVTINGRIAGTVTINGKNADILHSGYAENVNILAVAYNSYRSSNLTVNKISITDGHLALDAGTFVSKLVLPSVIANGTQITVENNADSTIGAVAIVDTEPTSSTKGKIIESTDGKVETSTTPSTTPVVIPSAIDFSSENGRIETATTENIKHATTAERSGPTEDVDTNTDAANREIATLAEFELFRDQVNAGATFENVRYTLTSNITLNDGWTPIGAFSRNYNGVRNAATGFAGEFDGNNYTISNLNNKGFRPTASMIGSNNTTVRGAMEYAYGLFGCVNGATIRNLNLANVNIDIKTVQSPGYGDSVGAFVGFGHGATLANLKVLDGVVKARDAVGGIIGRNYTANLSITDCENNATITGFAKIGGIAGYITNSSILVAMALSRNVNNGEVIALRAGDITQREAMQAAGIVVVSQNSVGIEVSSNTNNAKISTVTANNTHATESMVYINQIMSYASFADNGITASGNNVGENSQLYVNNQKLSSDDAANARFFRINK